jgi:hypothetical protein
MNERQRTLDKYIMNMINIQEYSYRLMKRSFSCTACFACGDSEKVELYSGQRRWAPLPNELSYSIPSSVTDYLYSFTLKAFLFLAVTQRGNSAKLFFSIYNTIRVLMRLFVPFLQSNRYSTPFKEPVDSVQNPKYYDLVKEPMGE